jgi:hypothetical protein
MRNRWSLAVVAVLLAGPVAAEQKGMEQAVATIESWGNDAQLAKFVAAQNAKGVTLDEIKRIDTAWQAGKTEVDALVKTILTNACAQRLKALIGANEAFGESFVMDNQGALVCATDKTSDYWQGDEPKWEKSFAGGKGAVFVDQARYDRSSKTTLAQVSVPVKQAGKVIGAITVGVRTSKLGQ